MRLTGVFILLMACGFIVYGIVTKEPSQSKTVKISIPDSRISELELKVKNLETWAQRQGMRY